MSTGFRVSIPNNMRKMIQAIKEITGNHSEEEVYAMLKECSMDPNETTQKLLLQDTFHEVKRKRDKRKENLSNREPGESRLRSGLQGRSRGNRGNYSPRVTSHDADGSRNSSSGKKNGSNQVSEKGIAISSFLTTQEDTKNKAPPMTSLLGNGPVGAALGDASVLHISQSSARIAKQQDAALVVDSCELGGALTLHSKATPSFRSGKTMEQPILCPINSLVSKAPESLSAVCSSSKDPVLVPSHDSQFPGMVGAIKCEVGIQHTLVEQNGVEPAQSKSAVLKSEVGSSFTQGKMPTEPQIQRVRENQLNESTQSLPASTHGSSIVNRPLSSNSDQPQVIGPQKVPNKEWKPKPTNSIPRQGSGAVCASEVLTMADEGDGPSPALLRGLDSEEATSKVQRKLEDLRQRHVIIPNHIQVPESERMKFCFGSIDAGYGVNPCQAYGLECDRGSTHSETSQGIQKPVDGQSSSDQNALPKSEESEYQSHAQSLAWVRENLSSAEGDVSTRAAPDYSEPEQETALPPGGHQYSPLHSSPSYNYGSVPPMLGTQVAHFESSDSETRTSSVVAQPPFDPTSYYAQLYRSNVESDLRISPFHLTGVATKYDGNVAVLSAQASQSSHEVENSLVFPTAGPTALVTQPVGVMQSSVAVTQQPVPVFRPPTGLHFPHYPPNFLPYGHYFSPFYIPPPAIHHYLSNGPNGAFPHQPQASSIYPPPPPAVAMGIKYSLSQYKPGTNMSNATSNAMASTYGSYESTPANHNPSSAATTVSNLVNEDLAASQLMESNVHVSGRQTEGSAAWVAGPGCDIPGLQASSFYNLSHQGQHVTFSPTQVAHGTFGSVYHPGQAVTAANIHPLLQQPQTIAGATDIGCPVAGIFQQPQHAQMNWPNSY